MGEAAITTPRPARVLGHPGRKRGSFPHSFVHHIRRFWTWLTDDHVVLAHPNVERHFARCTTCGRVFMHYWGCVTAEDRARGRQVGCTCGGMRLAVTRLPEYHAAWLVLSRYLWRRLILNELFWDPRIPARKRA